MTNVTLVQVAFDYDALEPKTRLFVYEWAQEIRVRAQRSAQDIIEIGRGLSEVKEALGHGRFLDWIDKEFGWSIRSAQRFMTVYDCFKNDTVSYLEIEISALYLIAAPSTHQSARTNLIGRAVSGETITKQTALATLREMKKPVIAPEPDEARQRAIETGKPVLDSEGWYQPPVTIEREEEVGNLLDLFDLILGLSESDLLHHDPRELLDKFAGLRWPEENKLRHIRLDQFIAWLTEFDNERKKRGL